MKEKFIQDLVEMLNSINEVRVEDNRYSTEPSEILDVCFMVSSIEQHIEKNIEFMNDITKYDFRIEGYLEDPTSIYALGKIEVRFYKKGDFSCWVDSIVDYYYEIEFMQDDRSLGYCECISEDLGYNKDHDCCGNGCNWFAPAFSLKKITDMDNYSWDGNESDYWAYEIKFKSNDKNVKEEIEKLEKQRKIDFYEKEILKLEEKLKELKDDN